MIDFYSVIVVVDHSFNITNGAANDSDTGLVDDTMVVLTTTVTACTETITETVTQTTTESYTVYLTATPSLSPTQSPSPTLSSNAAGSTSCSSSDTDNTPIYVAVTIAIVGLLITITIVVVGVLLCRCHQIERDSYRSSVPLNAKYRNTNGTDTGKVLMVVDNDLYGKEIRPQSQ